MQKFSIALSYASENEHYVTQVESFLLRMLGDQRPIFKFPCHMSESLGRDLRHFLKEKFSSVKFVVAFISKEYTSKEFPMLELNSAQSPDALAKGVETIVVLDDGVEIPTTVSHLSRMETIKETPETVAEKIYNKVLEFEKKGAVVDRFLSFATTNEAISSLLQKGYYCVIQKQYDDAIKYYDKAIDLDPKQATIYTCRGMAYACFGNFPQAIKDYNKAIDLDKNLGLAYFNRANALGNTGAWQHALSEYEKALELMPRSLDVRVGIAVAKSSLGRRLEAIKEMDIVINNRHMLYRTYLMRAKMKNEHGLYNNAFLDYTEATKYVQSAAEGHLGRGQIYALLGEVDNALEEFNQSIELDDLIAMSYYCRGLVYGMRKIRDKAKRDFKSAMALTIDPRLIMAINMHKKMFEIN